MASPRTIARLEAQIQRRVAHCVQFELADPRASFVTIVRVELNSDLTLAKIHYSVLGDDADRSKAAHMLDHAKGYIRRQMSSVLRTKTTPDIRWVVDTSMEDAEQMDDLIERTLERDREIRGDGASGDGASGDGASGDGASGNGASRDAADAGDVG